MQEALLLVTPAPGISLRINFSRGAEEFFAVRSGFGRHDGYPMHGKRNGKKAREMGMCAMRLRVRWQI